MLLLVVSFEQLLANLISQPLMLKATVGGSALGLLKKSVLNLQVSTFSEKTIKLSLSRFWYRLIDGSKYNILRW